MRPARSGGRLAKRLPRVAVEDGHVEPAAAQASGVVDALVVVVVVVPVVADCLAPPQPANSTNRQSAKRAGAAQDPYHRLPA